jgi:Shikimate kinase
VLIGMPGCGKSSVGQCVSRQLGMPLVDTDAMVEARAGCTISALFAERGEAAFRDMESACADEAAAFRGVVIATGGGMILRPGNMEALARNGLIIFLDRHPEDILREACLADRPLVADDSAPRIWKLYHERLPLYRRHAGHDVSNAGPISQVAQTVAALYTEHQRKR